MNPTEAHNIVKDFPHVWNGYLELRDGRWISAAYNDWSVTQENAVLVLEAAFARETACGTYRVYGMKGAPDRFQAVDYGGDSASDYHPTRLEALVYAYRAGCRS